ncbi:hypothetical protein OG970_27865 [Streptomyces sp. NBC_00658]
MPDEEWISYGLDPSWVPLSKDSRIKAVRPRTPYDRTASNAPGHDSPRRQVSPSGTVISDRRCRHG